MNAIVNVNIPSGWGIGAQGRLLSHISADMKQFAAATAGKVVLYGRKTLETFPGKRPLKNRVNVILSRDPAYTVENAVVVHSLDELFDACRAYDPDDLWVIGGESVYRALLPYCRTVRVTRSFEDLGEADAFFPDLDHLPGWHVVKESEMLEDEGKRYQFADYKNEVPCTF
jgi:dihydrofolate reductase